MNALIPIEPALGLLKTGCIVIIAFCVIFLLSGVFGRDSPINLGGIVLMLLICIGTLFGIGVVESMITMEVTPSYNYNVSTYQPIASLKDNSFVSGGGNFFLGIGSVKINENPKYVYYEILPEGYYKLGSVSTDITLIKEDGGDNPTLEKKVEYTRMETKKRVPAPGWAENYTEGGFEYMNSVVYILHVPNGTVVKEYKLDAELK